MLIGISFTEAEKDSINGWLQSYRDEYKKLHEQPTPNSLTWPFTFHPEPPGLKYLPNSYPLAGTSHSPVNGNP